MLRLSWYALRAISAANRLIVRRFTPAGRVLAAVMVAAAVMGIDTERSMTYQLFTLALALFAVSLVFLWRFRPRVAVRRDLPPHATAGIPCAYRLVLENRGSTIERDLIVEDNIGDPRPGLEQFLRSGAPPGARSFIERHSGYARWRWLLGKRGDVRIADMRVDALAPGSSIELASRFTSHRRGVLRFASLRLARSDPFGLVKTGRVTVSPQSICVLPRRYRLPRISLPGARRFQHGGVALAASVGDSEEFVSLREYRPGDPLKRMHWPSFARTGEPIVREYQDEFFERHSLVLDTFVDPEREPAFEEAVSIAASLVCAVDTHDCLLDLVFIGDQPVCLTSGRGLAASERLLEHLAVVEPTRSRPFADLAAALLGRHAELTSAILLFAQWDDEREALCKRLIGYGVPTAAYAIVSPGERPEAMPHWLKRLELGQVERDLAKSVAASP